MATKTWQLHAANEPLLAKQIRRWEDSKKLRLQTPEPSRTAVEECICISRQVGAGGSGVAARVAERLDWAMFDRELLHMMAGDDAMRERVYASMDERDVSWFEDAARSFGDPDFGRNDYFRQLTRSILSIARQGHAVFLGRGAGMILPGESTISVRIVAPSPFRIAKFATMSDLTKKEAEDMVERLEQERRAFVLRHFRKEVDDPSNYDLTLNGQRMSTETMADIILATRAARHGELIGVTT